MTSLRTIATVFVLSGLLLSPALAQDKRFDFRRDVEQELQKPNVKLVVVILSAEWCVPCKKEKPVWKRLRRLYGSQGVRFHLIRFQDTANKMTRYRWPHREFWDDEGRWGDAFGIGDAIPAAFLWSWQGKLLKKKGKVPEIKEAIEGYLGDNPRVLVNAYQGKRGRTDAALRLLVETELLRRGKFEVVSDEDDRSRMAELAEESHRLDRDEKQKCALGRDMSPNMLLKATLLEGNLYIKLKNIETKCDIQGGRADVTDRKQLAGAVSYALTDLLGNLRESSVEQPSGAMLAITKETADGRPVKPAAPTAGLVTFESTPPGATVTLDGKELGKTPLTFLSPLGAHRLEMKLAEHVTQSEVTNLTDLGTVAWTLTEDFALLSLTTTPPNIAVKLDGKPITTPLTNHSISVGTHTITVPDPCYGAEVKTITAKHGGRPSIQIKATLRTATILVRAVTSTGKNVREDVLVDGKALGKTNQSIPVSICAKQIAVHHKNHWPWSATLSLKENGRAQFKSKLFYVGKADPKTGDMRTFEGLEDEVPAVALSPNARYALSGSHDNTTKLWDVTSGKLIRTLKGHTDDVTSVAFSPSGKHALSGSRDDTLKLWEVPSGKLIRTFTGHDSGVACVAFGPTGKIVASGSWDKTLRLWETGTGELVFTYNHNTAVQAVTFGANGKYVVTGGRDGTTRLWQRNPGKYIRNFEGRRNVRSVAISPNGKYVLTGGYDVDLWEIDTGKLIDRMFPDGRPRGAYTAAFSPDGKLVYAYGTVWNVASGKVIAELPHPGNPPSVVSSDGKYVFEGSWYKSPTLLKFPGL